LDFESNVSTNSTTWAILDCKNRK